MTQTHHHQRSSPSSHTQCTGRAYSVPLSPISLASPPPDDAGLDADFEEAKAAYERDVCAMLDSRGGPGTKEYAKTQFQAKTGLGRPRTDRDGRPMKDGIDMGTASRIEMDDNGEESDIEIDAVGEDNEGWVVPEGLVTDRQFESVVDDAWWVRNAERYRQRQLHCEAAYLARGGRNPKTRFSYLRKHLLKQFGIPRDYYEKKI